MVNLANHRDEQEGGAQDNRCPERPAKPEAQVPDERGIEEEEDHGGCLSVDSPLGSLWVLVWGHNPGRLLGFPWAFTGNAADMLLLIGKDMVRYHTLSP